MKLEKRTRAILVGASILMVVVLALPAPRASVEPQSWTPPEPETPVQSGPEVIDGARLLEQRRRSGELTWSRDPFAAAPADMQSASSTSTPSLPVPEQAAGVPALTGISVSGGNRMAVIDRLIVREGDGLLSGYTVVRISARAVELSRDGEELVLSLGEER